MSSFAGSRQILVFDGRRECLHTTWQQGSNDSEQGTTANCVVEEICTDCDYQQSRDGAVRWRGVLVLLSFATAIQVKGKSSDPFG